MMDYEKPSVQEQGFLIVNVQNEGYQKNLMSIFWGIVYPMMDIVEKRRLKSPKNVLFKRLSLITNNKQPHFQKFFKR